MLWSLMRASTSASHACGSTPLSRAVWISVYMTAARSPPRSEPANSHDLRPSAMPRSSRSGIVGETNLPIAEKACKGGPALEHVVHRLGHLRMAREFGAFGPHLGFEVCNQRCDLTAAHSQTFVGGEATDLALDIKDRIDALDRCERQRRDDRQLPAHLGPAVGPARGPGQCAVRCSGYTWPPTCARSCR